MFWGCSGAVLELFQGCSGLVLGVFWVVLGSFWGCSGVVLGLFWGCSGGVLGLRRSFNIQRRRQGYPGQFLELDPMKATPTPRKQRAVPAVSAVAAPAPEVAAVILTSCVVPCSSLALPWFSPGFSLALPRLFPGSSLAPLVVPGYSLALL